MARRNRGVHKLLWYLVAVGSREVVEVAPKARCREVGDRCQDIHPLSEDLWPKVRSYHVVWEAVPERLKAVWPWIRPIRAVAPRPQQPAAILHGVEREACHKVPHCPMDAWMWRRQKPHGCPRQHGHPQSTLQLGPYSMRHWAFPEGVETRGPVMIPVQVTRAMPRTHVGTRDGV